MISLISLVETSVLDTIVDTFADVPRPAAAYRMPPDFM